jgi:hypothetical protein
VIRAAIAVVSRDDHEGMRALIALVPFTSLDLAQDALAAAARILAETEWRRDDHSGAPLGIQGDIARSLAEIAPHLHANLLPHVLAVSGGIDPTERPPVLGALADRFRTLPLSQLEELWDQARAALAVGDRTEILETLAVLAPAIDIFGGAGGVRESARAVRVIAR